VVDAVQKTADVVGATTVDPSWAGALVQTDGPFADFAEWLRPQTILGRFGTNGIPALRRVPFRVGLVSQTSGGQGYWVGESQPKPLTTFGFARTTMLPLKVANITVLSEEVIRDSSPSAETLVRDQLAAALSERLDTDFIDPGLSATATSPASILNGVSGLNSNGNQIAAVLADINQLIAAFKSANNPLNSGVFIMSELIALQLAMLQNPLGQQQFPTVTMSGGSLYGIPILTSQFLVDTPTGGTIVALINASDIYFADEGGISVDLSREASLEMVDPPTNTPNTLGSPPASTGASLVSMFQTNNVAFRAERTINWMRRRESGVAWLTGVNWGEAGSP